MFLCGLVSLITPPFTTLEPHVVDPNTTFQLGLGVPAAEPVAATLSNGVYLQFHSKLGSAGDVCKKSMARQ